MYGLRKYVETGGLITVYPNPRVRPAPTLDVSSKARNPLSCRLCSRPSSSLSSISRLPWRLDSRCRRRFWSPPTRRSNRSIRSTIPPSEFKQKSQRPFKQTSWVRPRRPRTQAAFFISSMRLMGCPACTHASIPPSSGRIFLKPACLRCFAAVAADSSLGHAQ